MCTTYASGCVCFRSQEEFDDECERIAVASTVEHDVLAALLDADAPPVSPRAARLAEAIRRHPLANGGTLADVLVTDSGVFFWLADDGRQHHVPLDRVPATIRLAA